MGTQRLKVGVISEMKDWKSGRILRRALLDLIKPDLDENNEIMLSPQLKAVLELR